MGFAEDIADDLSYCDDLKSVTLTNTAGVTSTVAGCVVSAVNGRDVKRYDGLFDASICDRKVRMSVSNLSGTIPAEGDRIVSESRAYLVKHVDLVSFDNEYLCFVSEVPNG